MQIWCWRITVLIFSNQSRHLCFVLLPNFANAVINTLPMLIKCVMDQVNRHFASIQKFLWYLFHFLLLIRNPRILHLFEELLHSELANLEKSWCCYRRGMLGNSHFFFPWDLSEVFCTIMIAFTLLLWIAVCLCKLSPDFFTSVHRDLQCIHCFINYKPYWH